MANSNTTSANAASDSNPNVPPERAMTMSEPPSYMATVASSAPHTNANAMEQGLADTTPIRQLQSESAMIICPHCNRRASTRVDTQNTTSTYIVGCLLCLVCIIASILPCLLGWFNDNHHYCSDCGKEVAIRHSNGEITVKRPEGVKNYNTVPTAGNSYPMVDMGGGSNSGLAHGQQTTQQQQPQSEEQQSGGRQDEHISSFLSTNAPREETASAPPVKN